MAYAAWFSGAAIRETFYAGDFSVKRINGSLSLRL